MDADLWERILKLDVDLLYDLSNIVLSQIATVQRRHGVAMSDPLDRIVSQRDYPRQIAIFMVGDLQLFLMGVEHAPFMVNRVRYLKLLFFFFKGVRLNDCVLY